MPSLAGSSPMLPDQDWRIARTKMHDYVSDLVDAAIVAYDATTEADAGTVTGSAIRYDDLAPQYTFHVLFETTATILNMAYVWISDASTGYGFDTTIVQATLNCGYNAAGGTLLGAGYTGIAYGGQIDTLAAGNIDPDLLADHAFWGAASRSVFDIAEKKLSAAVTRDQTGLGAFTCYCFCKVIGSNTVTAVTLNFPSGI